MRHNAKDRRLLSPSSNRTCGFAASGFRRLFTNDIFRTLVELLSQIPNWRLHCRVSWVFISLSGHHPVLLASSAPTQLPRLRSKSITDPSLLLCRTPTPALAASVFPVSGVVPGVADRSTRGQASRVTPSALPNMPSPLTPPDRCADSNGCPVRPCQPSSFR
jgi:hypothetical protein